MDFLLRARTEVLNYANNHLCPTDGVQISIDDVYVVWFCYILGNQKALVSTRLHDGMYYEVTLDSSKDVIYFDAYKKFDYKVADIDDYK